MSITPYLIFEGRCDEAIAFYGKAIGAQVQMLMRYGEAPPMPEGAQGQEGCPPGAMPPSDKVMHAALSIGGATLMCADGMASGEPRFEGISLSLAADDDAHAARLFEALADGGQVQQPLIRTFFASSFGMVKDRFGVVWMILKQLDMPAR